MLTQRACDDGHIGMPIFRAISTWYQSCPQSYVLHKIYSALSQVTVVYIYFILFCKFFHPSNKKVNQIVCNFLSLLIILGFLYTISVYCNLNQSVIEDEKHSPCTRGRLSTDRLYAYFQIQFVLLWLMYYDMPIRNQIFVSLVYSLLAILLRA